MLKHRTLILASILLVCVLSSGFFDASGRQRRVDHRYVGMWEGETIRKDGRLKKWQQTRFENGNYIIHFEYYEEGKLSDTAFHTGKWWIKLGNYHEIIEPGGAEFVYRIEWISDDCLKYVSIKRDASGDEYEGYTFTECRSASEPQ